MAANRLGRVYFSGWCATIAPLSFRIVLAVLVWQMN